MPATPTVFTTMRAFDIRAVGVMLATFARSAQIAGRLLSVMPPDGCSHSHYSQICNTKLPAVVLTLLVVGPEVRGQQRLPIIGVHLHAHSQAEWNGQPPNPVTGKPAPETGGRAHAWLTTLEGT